MVITSACFVCPYVHSNSNASAMPSQVCQHSSITPKTRCFKNYCSVFTIHLLMIEALQAGSSASSIHWLHENDSTVYVLVSWLYLKCQTIRHLYISQGSKKRTKLIRGLLRVKEMPAIQGLYATVMRLALNHLSDSCTQHYKGTVSRNGRCRLCDPYIQFE